MKAVIFDMYETLISHFQSPLYLGAEIAKEAGISPHIFLPLWRNPNKDLDRSIGKLTLEEMLTWIFQECNCYSEELVQRVIHKRMKNKEELFLHLNPQIIPMLEALGQRDIAIGLISNCYSEEATIIRNSVLFPYFDGVCLSYEQGIVKPNPEIYHRCMEQLSVTPKDCLYIGDGGSHELEGAKKLGMNALQAMWYYKGSSRQVAAKNGFIQLENPMEVLDYI